MSRLSTLKQKLSTLDFFVVILLVVCSLVLLPGINSNKINTWDELTNIEVVNESSGLELMYSGKSFFEKPPLWYWAVGLMNSFLGNHLWVFRLPSAMSAAGIVITLYIFLKKRGTRLSAFLVSIAFLLIPQNLITNFGGYFSSHTFRSADLDAMQIFLIFLSSLLILEDRKHWIFSCMLLALAFMVKGPLALVFLVVNSIFFFRDRLEFDLKAFILGIFLFFLITAPWHIYMFYTFGDNFVDSYFGYHLISRSVDTIEKHSQPMWFYLKIFFDFRMNPFWPVFVIAIFKNNLQKEYLRYSLIVVVALLVLFTVVGTKLAWYILPVYPYMLLFIHGLFSNLNPSAIITKFRR